MPAYTDVMLAEPVKNTEVKKIRRCRTEWILMPH